MLEEPIKYIGMNRNPLSRKMTIHFILSCVTIITTEFEIIVCLKIPVLADRLVTA